MYKFYNSNAYKGSLTPGAFHVTISGAALWRHASTPHSLLSDILGTSPLRGTRTIQGGLFQSDILKIKKGKCVSLLFCTALQNVFEYNYEGNSNNDLRKTLH